MLCMFTAATTSSGVKYNSLKDELIKESRFPRQVNRIALAGSAAAGDIKFTLYFGSRVIAELYCSTTGAVFPNDDDVKTLAGGEVCPAGVEIRLEADDSSTTNPVYGILETKELIRRRRRFARRRRY